MLIQFKIAQSGIFGSMSDASLRLSEPESLSRKITSISFVE